MEQALYCVKMADVDVRKHGLLTLGPHNVLTMCTQTITHLYSKPKKIRHMARRIPQ